MNALEHKQIYLIEKLSDLETKLAPALTTLANLEKRLANLENTAIQGVIL